MLISASIALRPRTRPGSVRAVARIGIIGAGYVGLCTGVALTRHGHRVTLVDTSPERLDSIRRGRPPFHEPGLDSALKRAIRVKRLRLADAAGASVPQTEATFLCVGTPPRDGGAVDLTQVESAARDVGRALRARKGYHLVLVKSTVPPGTVENVVRPILERASGKPAGSRFGVVSNPEFLKEGAALTDAFAPDRIVIGASEPAGARAAWRLYAKHRCPRISTTPRTAETIKYAANAFLAAKIALSNELANVCERIGVDWYDVAPAIGHDPRIGPLFLRAGMGFGGSCFPKDIAALRAVARSSQVSTGMLDALLDQNARQPLEVARMLREELGSLRGKRIALLGLSFKPNTDDVRETRSLPLLKALVREGAVVVAHDPRAMNNFRTLASEFVAATSAADALRGADAAAFATEWPEYKALRPSLVRSLMRSPIVVDGRRSVDAGKMRTGGIRYRAIGLGEA